MKIMVGKDEKIMKMVQEHKILFTCKLVPIDVIIRIELSDNHKLFSKRSKNQ